MVEASFSNTTATLVKTQVPQQANVLVFSLRKPTTFPDSLQGARTENQKQDQTDALLTLVVRRCLSDFCLFLDSLLSAPF